MSTEQRRALANTIPPTEVIKDAVTFPRDRLGEPLDISPERFDAWLARVRRDAAEGHLRFGGGGDDLANGVLALLDQLDQAEARIQAVRALHTGTTWPGVTDTPICDGCDQPWPCPTIRALEV